MRPETALKVKHAIFTRQCVMEILPDTDPDLILEENAESPADPEDIPNPKARLVVRCLLYRLQWTIMKLSVRWLHVLQQECFPLW